MNNIFDTVEFGHKLINSSKNFIKATNEYNTIEKPVNAPYIRKTFFSDNDSCAKVLIAACGFYELYINGIRYTKGFLAPYISNPEHYIYYDEYEVKIDKGENVIGVLLGNGFQNNPAGYIWDFDKASFRSAPMLYLTLTYQNSDGEYITIKSDKTFKTHPSPIVSDELRFGEVYDANLEIERWNCKDFDDSKWDNVIETVSPGGELKLCEATPIVKETELLPVKIFKDGEGYIYDFGQCNAGMCKLNIDGKRGQKIEIQHADTVKDGKLYIDPIWFGGDNWEKEKNLIQKDIYICKGEKNEIYTPTFTYHGFRYAKVTGITPEQATNELLTYVVIHSELKSMGGFNCSDNVINQLQEMTRRSDVSNYQYFPVDCPQREKNGWTADAALSCEQMLLNFNPEAGYREWLRNICKAQDEKGALPGIIPTSGWGFKWGNGPAWDCALVYLPYYVYVYRGETEMIKESADNFMAYLKYLMSRADEKGLIHFGLGDWCHVGSIETPKAPLEVTDSIISMDIANKMAFLFDAVGLKEEYYFALLFADKLKKAIRDNLIDYDTMTAFGNCQTSQAMCLYYNVFNEEEEETAFRRLLDMIHKEDDHMDVGVLGGRVIFHVLSKFGQSDLAYKMITRPDYPSYGNWIERGATTLWECFFPEDGYDVYSANHHFWGDISSWFIKRIAGINYNPYGNDLTRLEICPSFVSALTDAEGYHISPKGKILSSWKREENKIILNLEIPSEISTSLVLEKGYSFVDRTTEKNVSTGTYEIIAL